jgi:uncharacterized protein (DUF885 family)
MLVGMLRQIVRLAGIALLCLACQQLPGTASPDERVLAISDAWVAEALEGAPASVARLRPPGARYDGLPDDSLAGVAARRARWAAWLAELRSIDRDAIEGDAARLAYDLATTRLADAEALSVCRAERWNVSQMTGWHVGFAGTALSQPVETPELRDQALARFAKLPAYADAQIEALRAGLAEGRTAPRRVVDLVLGQLGALIEAPPEADPFASPAQRTGDPAFGEAYLALVGTDVEPALRRYRDFLAEDYAPHARTTVGVSALPDGEACYRAALRWSTTLDISADEVHARGLAALETIEAEMQAIANESFEGAALPELLQRFRSDPAFLHRDREHVLEIAARALERGWAALPRAFGRIPSARAILEPIPAFQERTAAPHYLQAALDGSQPATYRVRLYAPTRQSWTIGESTAFHEVVPGHHLQIALANENEALPDVARFVFSSGFVEGWALYAEQLADELGLYSGPADRIGMLSNRAWRAVRMVVDTGLHVKGWSRERAIAFALAHTALSEDQAAQEIDRYIAWPGQATSYLVGYEAILALRNETEQALGERFDLRAFHDAVLAGGSLTLPVLRARVLEWIARQ